jgi:hypothetical protein
LAEDEEELSMTVSGTSNAPEAGGLGGSDMVYVGEAQEEY